MRFLIGLLLGMLVGIGGTAFFLTTGKGGDYLIGSSPRVLEMEARLKASEGDREAVRKRLGEADAALARLEARVAALAGRPEAGTATGAAAAAAAHAPAAAAADAPPEVH